MEYREMSRAEAELEGARRLRVVLETGKWPPGAGVSGADRRVIVQYAPDFLERLTRLREWLAE